MLVPTLVSENDFRSEINILETYLKYNVIKKIADKSQSISWKEQVMSSVTRSSSKVIANFFTMYFESKVMFISYNLFEKLLRVAVMLTEIIFNT